MTLRHPARSLLCIAVLAASAATSASAAPPSLAVDAAANRHAISEDIYGINYASENLATWLRLPVRRWGGNSTTRYNYLIDVHNTGSDYYFENIPDGDGTEAGRSSNQFIDQDRRTGTRTLMTVPTIGWTPTRRLANHPYDCGFKVSKYGAQDSTDFYDADCGSGNHAGGGAITGNVPGDTSTAITGTFVTGWVNYLKGRYGPASAGGVAYYSLDNEPALWNSTHRDVHPQPLTYDELRNRTYEYGAAVKVADATAKTLGPAEWGWCGYFFSGADNGGCGNGPDRQAHGDVPLVDWYLQQMKAYELAHGVRILDYLDLHYYPQAAGVALSSSGSVATRALRLRSTRSLWDPTYTEESWINDLGMGPIRMIPRMKEWVANNYPGTRIAISEYNWGGLEGINGALAQADVLGIFGREGLDLATLWSAPAATDPGAFAFGMYRNYDNAGHGFGETSVNAASTDQGTVSVYAAQRAADGALTVMVLNKSGSDVTSPLTLNGFSPQPLASAYRYSTLSANTIAALPNQPVSAAGFTATYPANSITLVVMLPALAPDGDADHDGIPNAIEPAEGRDPSVKDNDVFGNARLFAMQQYRDFLAREGDASGISYWTGQMNAGTQSRVQMIDTFFNSAEFQGTIAPVARLYFAYFLRLPDYDGLNFWIGQFRGGTSLDGVSQAFAQSPEFVNRYGTLDNTQFVNLVYTNVLGRPADAAGAAYWAGQLTSGAKTRGQVMTQFSESAEYANVIGSEVYVTMIYMGMLRRAPDAGGFAYWVAQKDQGSGQALIAAFLGSAEYRARFLP